MLQTAANLHGYVDPHGSATTYYFQWGLTAKYGINGTQTSAGSGKRPTAVHQAASGLMPDTTYHYRVVASNQFGVTFGSDRTFTTAASSPGATTDPAENVSATGATLIGTVNPEGAATSWYFEWGTSTTYGQQTMSQALPASSSPQKVSWSLAGLLAPGTIYHYRLVASHTLFTSYGEDESFMTYPSPRPVPRVTARTRPKHAHNRPYVFTTSGKLTAPSSIPGQYACAGQVQIRFFRGSRRVAHRSAQVQPNCTFFAVTVFQHLPGHRKDHKPIKLRVIVRFVGTSYLAPSKAPVRRVTLG